MSSLPPYESNPDQRPLPPGWITQFDPNYKTWFYVNTEAKPPSTTWIHPLGPVPTPAPERRYTPPPMTPPGHDSSTYVGGRGYNPTGSSGYDSGGYPSGNSGGNNHPYGEGYGGPRPEYGAGYGQNYSHSAGGRGGGTADESLSYGGGARMDGGYPAHQQPSHVLLVERQQKKSGLGTGGAIAVGAGAGLLGGVLLDRAMGGGDDEERENEGYEDDRDRENEGYEDDRDRENDGYEDDGDGDDDD